MVSVGVSALGTASIHFIEPGVKVNGQYYREDQLMQKRLPDIRQLSDFYVFEVEQDTAPAHLVRQLSCLRCFLTAPDARRRVMHIHKLVIDSSQAQVINNNNGERRLWRP